MHLICTIIWHYIIQICFAVVACIFPPMCCLILIALLQFDEFSWLTCLVVLTVCVSNSATRHICYTLIISSHIFWQFFLKFIVLCSYIGSTASMLGHPNIFSYSGVPNRWLWIFIIFQEFFQPLSPSIWYYCLLLKFPCMLTY